MSAGCQYREHDGEAPCNKLCDAGQEFCPHHLLLLIEKRTGAHEPVWSQDPRPGKNTTQDGAIQWTVLKTPRGYQE